MTVSWIAVSGSGISYTVWYSKSIGTTTDPPSGAFTKSEITNTSTTLSVLTQGTPYYIWVAAFSSDVQGLYSTRVSETTFEGLSAYNIDTIFVLASRSIYIIELYYYFVLYTYSAS